MPRRYTRLSFEEREEIALAVVALEPIRSIAARLGRGAVNDQPAGCLFRSRGVMSMSTVRATQAG